MQSADGNLAPEHQRHEKHRSESECGVSDSLSTCGMPSGEKKNLDKVTVC